MALLHELSSQTPLPGYDIFAVPPTQTTVERDILTQHRPLSTLDSNQPIEFFIPSSMDEYLNPREIKFYLRLHIRLKIDPKRDINDSDWERVTPVNNFLHSIFESVEVFLGDTQINNSGVTYPYRSYFDAILKYGWVEANSHHTAVLWYKKGEDRRVHIKTIKTADSEKYIGKSVDLGGILNIDLFNQDKSILGGSDMRIKLTPHKPSFYLNIASNPLKPTENLTANVIFEDASIEIHRSKLYEPVVNAHNEALKVANAKYPINRCEVKTFTINSGSLDALIDNAFTGQLPRKLYIALVKNFAFHGSYKFNPFDFKHCKIKFICCYYNSQQFPPNGFKPDFDKDKYIREYLGFYDAAGQLYGANNIVIGRSDYKNNNTIFGFNFSPDLSSDSNTSGYANLIKRGTLRVEIHFAEALTDTMNILMYAEYDNIIQISQERNAIIDYS